MNETDWPLRAKQHRAVADCILADIETIQQYRHLLSLNEWVEALKEQGRLAENWQAHTHTANQIEGN